MVVLFQVLDVVKSHGGSHIHVATDSEQCKAMWRTRKEALWAVKV
jgi:hypothetical protein